MVASVAGSTGEANTGEAIGRAGTDELDDFISAPQVGIGTGYHSVNISAIQSSMYSRYLLLSQSASVLC